MVHIVETYDDVSAEIQIIQQLHSQWIDAIILVSSVTEINEQTKAYVQSLSSLKKNDVIIPVVALEKVFLNDII